MAETIRPVLPSQTVGARYLPGLVIGLTVLVFGASVVLSRLQLRQQIRTQIADRDGEILTAVAQWQQYADEAEGTLIGPLEDPANQFAILLQISPLKGVIAARLFDVHGKFVNALPDQVTELDLPMPDVAELQKLKPTSHFWAHASLDQVFLTMPTQLAASAKRASLLEINIPLYPKDRRQLVGIAQFIIDGASIAAEFAALDRHLWQQGLTVFLIEGGAIILVLSWAFRRIARMNRLLSERSSSLLKANQELSLAVKTSAVGAVTAHLIHGLRNPLFGLQNLVAARSSAEGQGETDDWQMALANTQRMKSMIEEIVRILRDEQGVHNYELSLAELAEVVCGKAMAMARDKGVQFTVHRTGEATLSNHEANLIILILENLIHNAVQATPQGKLVRLNLAIAGEKILFDVQDEGPGLPETINTTLFSPCRSTKEGGIGLGLAISKQLAQHLAADLELKHSSAQGSIFTLAVPISGSKARSG